MARLRSLAVLLLLAPAALAEPPCDVDDDGYDTFACGGGDCDDADSAVHPGATDVEGDGIDQDCDGVDRVVGCDLDQDGHLALACGGDDCHDLDATVNPDAVEVSGDGIDQDCDGADACEAIWAQGGRSCATAPAVDWLGFLLVPLLVRRRR